MPIILILWPALLASVSRALPASDVEPRAVIHSTRNQDLHDRVDAFLKSNHLRLMLFSAHAGSPELVDYAVWVHPMVPTELAAHFLLGLARLEIAFAKQHMIDVAEIRSEVDAMLALASLNLRKLDEASVAGVIMHLRPALGARFATAFVSSVRASDPPRIPAGAPALSASFYTNLATHLDRAVSRAQRLSRRFGLAQVAAWTDRAGPSPVEAPVTIAPPRLPGRVTEPAVETIGLLRQALNLDACANAFAVTDEEATPEVAPAAAAAAVESSPTVIPEEPPTPTAPK